SIRLAGGGAPTTGLSALLSTSSLLSLSLLYFANIGFCSAPAFLTLSPPLRANGKATPEVAPPLPFLIISSLLPSIAPTPSNQMSSGLAKSFSRSFS
ncbi:hypothetical protein U1Q18_047906, partial [Sarracenia purpurea var. burkii]